MRGDYFALAVVIAWPFLFLTGLLSLVMGWTLLCALTLPFSCAYAYGAFIAAGDIISHGIHNDR